VLEYDVDTRRWTPKASVPVARGRGAAAVAVNGTKILMAGGVTAGQSANMLNTGVRQKDFLAYDTVTDTWQKLPDLALPRGYAAGAVTGNLFWVLGGSTDFVRTDQRDAFDLKAGQWIDKPPLPVTLSSLAAATLGGRVYVIGGIATGTGMITSETRVLDPMTASLVSVAPMKTPRFAMGAAAIGGRIYVPGGAALINPPSGFGATDALEVYIP
jgi:N-acetylneuraminic acid mutarotase